ncbi:MAG: hypothetical protein CME65_03670 [Halobacteriovoraceae bacterium]|nr:hypothetical protein [Halobacteriovoraceae bacterium]
MKKGIFTILLILSSISVFGQGIERPSEVLRLRDAYLGFGYDQLDSSLIRSHTQTVESFINSYSGPRDEDFDTLMRLHANAVNYLALEEALSDCNDNDRNLSARVLGVVGSKIKTIGHIYAPCSVVGKPVSAINELVEAGRNVVNPLLTNGLQQGLYQRAISNSFKSLMHHKYQYGENNFSSRAAIENFVQEVCDGRCSRDIYDPNNAASSSLIDELTRFKTQLEGVERHTNSSARDRLNELIQGEGGLNQTLSEVESAIGTESGFLGRDPVFTDESRMLMQIYHTQFNQVALQDPVGRLLSTEEMRDRVRAPRRLDEDDMSHRAGNFTFEKHREVSSSHIQSAVSQVTSTITDQIKELNLTEIQRNNRDVTLNLSNPQSVNQMIEYGNRDIRKFLRTNPAAVGEHLYHNPYYAHKVCELIGQVTESDDEEARNDKIWLYGGLIVGGVLLATGVGAGLGAWVLAGTAAGATLATVAATTGIVGIAVGLGEAGYHINEYMEFSAERDAITGAILTGGADAQSIQELQDAVTGLRRAQTAAIMSGAFAAFEMGTLYSAARVYMNGSRLASSGVSQIEHTSRMTRFLNSIANNPMLNNMVLRLKQAVGSERAARFMGYLSTASDSTRAYLLTRLARFAESGNFTELKRITDEAIAIADRTCRRR